MRAGAVNTPQAEVLRLLVQIDHATRQADHDAGKNQQRHAVADAALGDLLAQPHDEGAARGQRQHGHQDEARPGSVDEVARLLQADGNAERLHRTQNHGEITRPLGDFLAAHFAFFLQLGERLIDHCQQLQNDRRRNVRHDAQRENREPPQVAAAEQIHKAQHRAPVLLEELPPAGRH